MNDISRHFANLAFIAACALVCAAVFAAEAEVSSAKTVAVIPFASSGEIDASDELGASIASIFTAYLAMGDPALIKVVERASLDSILAEQRLSVSGFIDDASAVEIGRLTGASHLLMGDIALDSNTVFLTVALRDVATGEVTHPDVSSAPRDAYLHSIVNLACDYVYRLTGKPPALEAGTGGMIAPPGLSASFLDAPDPNHLVNSSAFPVVITLDKDGDTPEYRLGETVTITAECGSDCYLYLFNFSTGGGVKVIFPNAYWRDNFVKTGESVVIPPPDTFEWVHGPPA